MNAPGPRTPLGIIALFVGVIEAAFAYPVTQLQEPERMMFVLFMILFPTAVASAFFFMLWHRPIHLFSPTEITPGLENRYQSTIAESVDAKMLERMENAIKLSLTSSDLLAQLTQVKPGNTDEASREQMKRVLNATADKASEEVKEAMGLLSVDLKPVSGRLPRVEMIYQPTTEVRAFLDMLWTVYLGPFVPAHTYGRTWVLRDVETGKVWEELGSKWAQQNGMPADRRSLLHAGIMAGMRLEAIRIGSSDRVRLAETAHVDASIAD